MSLTKGFPIRVLISNGDIPIPGDLTIKSFNLIIVPFLRSFLTVRLFEDFLYSSSHLEIGLLTFINK